MLSPALPFSSGLQHHDPSSSSSDLSLTTAELLAWHRHLYGASLLMELEGILDLVRRHVAHVAHLQTLYQSSGSLQRYALAHHQQQQQKSLPGIVRSSSPLSTPPSAPALPYSLLKTNGSFGGASGALTKEESPEDSRAGSSQRPRQHSPLVSHHHRAPSSSSLRILLPVPSGEFFCSVTDGRSAPVLLLEPSTAETALASPAVGAYPPAVVLLEQLQLFESAQVYALPTSSSSIFPTTGAAVSEERTDSRHSNSSNVVHERSATPSSTSFVSAPLPPPAAITSESTSPHFVKCQEEDAEQQQQQQQHCDAVPPPGSPLPKVPTAKPSSQQEPPLVRCFELQSVPSVGTPRYEQWMASLDHAQRTLERAKTQNVHAVDLTVEGGLLHRRFLPARLIAQLAVTSENSSVSGSLLLLCRLRVSCRAVAFATSEEAPNHAVSSSSSSRATAAAGDFFLSSSSDIETVERPFVVTLAAPNQPHHQDHEVHMMMRSSTPQDPLGKTATMGSRQQHQQERSDFPLSSSSENTLTAVTTTTEKNEGTPRSPFGSFVLSRAASNLMMTAQHPSPPPPHHDRVLSDAVSTRGEEGSDLPPPNTSWTEAMQQMTSVHLPTQCDEGCEFLMELEYVPGGGGRQHAQPGPDGATISRSLTDGTSAASKPKKSTLSKLFSSASKAIAGSSSSSSSAALNSSSSTSSSSSTPVLLAVATVRYPNLSFTHQRVDLKDPAKPHGLPIGHVEVCCSSLAHKCFLVEEATRAQWRLRSRQRHQAQAGKSESATAAGASAHGIQLDAEGTPMKQTQQQTWDDSEGAPIPAVEKEEEKGFTSPPVRATPLKDRGDGQYVLEDEVTPLRRLGAWEWETAEFDSDLY